MTSVLTIDELVLEAIGSGESKTVVSGVSLEVARGESLGVVGESGSGKSLTMLSAMGLLPPGVRRVSGRIAIDGRDIVGLNGREMRGIRGRTVGMVFQDPMSALNPLRAVGAQVAAAVRVHAPGITRRQARNRAVELLQSVGVRDAAERAATRPHQWSGGMRQRAVIAMAMAHDPLLIIADEPTTALDVTVQAQVMSLLDDVRERTGSALVLITHDLGLVSENTSRIAVMNQGRVVEHGETSRVLAAPEHSYTERLLAARPEAMKPNRPGIDAHEFALRADNIAVEYRGAAGAAVRAVDGVNVHVRPGETVAIVGESGCGKSSLARAILGIQPATAGSVELAGEHVPPALANRSARQREDAQLVFQDPYSALDPRLTIEEIVAEPLRIRRAYRRERVLQLLTDVGLDETFARRTPAQLSGGQRQRVGIARALALRPKLLVLDEPVSALDVSIQAQVLELLDRIQKEHRLGYLFISHDLGVVRNISDRVIVMHQGHIVEEAATEDIFASPQHPYTRTLLDAVPRITQPA